MAIATAAFAAVALSQPATWTPSQRPGSSPVVFMAGDDAASLASLGFVDTPTLHASGASVDLAVYGIPGATHVLLDNVLKVSNPDTADDLAYDVTLAASGALTGVTVFTVSFSDGSTTHTIDLLAGGSLASLNLADGEAWSLSVKLGVSPTATPTGSVRLDLVATQA